MVRHKTLRKHYLRKNYYKNNKKKTRTKRTKRQKMRGGDTYKALNLLKDNTKYLGQSIKTEAQRQLNNTKSMFDLKGERYQYIGRDGLKPGYDEKGDKLPYGRREIERLGYELKGPGGQLGEIISAPFTITKGLLIGAPISMARGTGALIKAYKTPSDKNIADIIVAMESFDKKLKSPEAYLNKFWRDESEFLKNKITELNTNSDIQDPIYTIARTIKQNIEGQNNLKNDIPQIPRYSTLRLEYLPHIKPLILSLRSSDNPNIKLEKFNKIKEHIDKLLDMILKVQQESKIEISRYDTAPLDTINDILIAAITELGPNSGPLEKPEEGAPIVQKAPSEETKEQVEQATTGGKYLRGIMRKKIHKKKDVQEEGECKRSFINCPHKIF